MVKNKEIYSIDTEDIRKEINKIKIIINEQKKLKETMDEELGFEVPDYVIEEIYEEAYYHNICLLINLAVINNRISKENSEILKEAIKNKYNIKNMYDRCVFKE